MNKSFFVLVLLLALSPAATVHAATAQDLGAGLAYYRLTTLPADLPASATAKACILDLRYATGDDAAGDALTAWLKFHAGPRTPVLLLANAATAPALLHALSTAALPAGTLTLGQPAPGFAPDVPITKTTADTERRAYDAFAQGTTLAALIEEKVTKPRHDEAEMVRRRAAGEPWEYEPADEDEKSTPGTIAPATPAPAISTAPLIDATLQRAVHLHRALQALGR